MADDIYPSLEAKKTVFVIDASNAVEQQLLEDWISTLKTQSQGSSSDSSSKTKETTNIIVPISVDPENIPSERLECLNGFDYDTLVVPVRIAWAKSSPTDKKSSGLREIFWGKRARPNATRATRILSKEPERALKVVAKTATLSELKNRFLEIDGNLSDQKQFASYIAGQASLALDVAERQHVGGRYKVPRRVAENIKASPSFKQALSELSSTENTPMSELLDETDVIMKEMIATPSPLWLDFAGGISRKLTSLAYASDIVFDPKDLARVKNIVNKHPTAFLWTHKTHVDGMALQKVFYENDFPAAHTFGGLNMAFAGMGHASRKSGVIFIRRTFQDNPLYKLILRHYIGYLLEKRFPFSWAFEGTRSRVGKLMPPRYGLLKYLIEAAEETDTKNLHFIPVAINYDMIGDVSDHAKEQSGEVKQAESLKWFVGYLRGMRQPMGRIYMDFGEPVVLEDAPDGQDKMAMSKMAFQVGVEVNRVSPITLASVVTMVLLAAVPRALSADELGREILRIVKWVRARGIRISSDFDIGNRLQADQLAQILVANDLVTVYGEDLVKLYTVSPEQHVVASYYRNTTVHYFVNKAIAELALLAVTSVEADRLNAFWREAERLRDLFKFEFFYSPRDEFRRQITVELNEYDPYWEENLQGSSDYADQMLRGFEPLVAHATLMQFTEAYWISSTVFARAENIHNLEEKDFVADCLSYGKQAYLQRRIRSKASIGKELFKNGLKLLRNLDLTQDPDSDPESNKVDPRLEIQSEFRNLIGRLERIRARTLPS